MTMVVSIREKKKKKTMLVMILSPGFNDINQPVTVF